MNFKEGLSAPAVERSKEDPATDFPSLGEREREREREREGGREGGKGEGGGFLYVDVYTHF